MKVWREGWNRFCVASVPHTGTFSGLWFWKTGLPSWGMVRWSRARPYWGSGKLMQKGRHIILPYHASKSTRGCRLGSRYSGAVLWTDEGVVPQVLALRNPTSTRRRITFGKELLQDGPLLVCSLLCGRKQSPIPSWNTSSNVNYRLW